MSQDIRDYRIRRIEQNDNEAREIGITSTVMGTDEYGRRAIQITLETQEGYAYGRLTEPQIRDLIRVLETRVDPQLPFEATGFRADRLQIKPDGSIRGIPK